MIKYFRMKRKEIELKLIIYGYLLKFMENKETIVPVAINLLQELSSMPQEELLNLFIDKMVHLDDEHNFNKTD